MDPERQALLNPASERRPRRRRALTYDEVLLVRHNPCWRRARCLLVMLFWSILAMFLSMVACILMSVTDCSHLEMPSVPPVHLTFTPLVRH